MALGKGIRSGAAGCPEVRVSLVVGLGVRGVSREAVKFPQIAVEGVGSRLGGDVDDAAGCTAILRLEVAGDHAELLYGVDRDEDTDAGSEDGDIFHAIEQDLRAGGALTIDVVADAAGGGILSIAAGLAVAAVGGVARRDVAGDGNEVIGIAREAGQLRNLLLIHDLREFLGLRVHLRSAFGQHLHLSHTGADRKLGIDRHAAAGGDFGFRRVWLEVAGLNRNLVGRRFKTGDGVRAAGGSRGRAHRVGADVLYRDIRRGDNRAGGVGYGSGYLTGFELSVRE